MFLNSLVFIEEKNYATKKLKKPEGSTWFGDLYLTCWALL